MTIKEILQEAIIKLKENNIDKPNNKARRLLAHEIQTSKEYLISHDNDEISEKQKSEYNKKIESLINGIPIQYIIGFQEFMGIEFFVNENVLIPQPDTEILVEKTIEILKNYQKPKVLDLCTGSGAIAISISKYFPKAEVIASDISNEALEVANLNNKEDKVKFINSNLFDNIQDKFDVIVSNPPYIKTSELKTLSKEVLNEPILALDGGEDGLVFYKKIIEQAYKFLNANGYLCLEIGEDQLEEITLLLEKNSNYVEIKKYKDLAGNNRVITCKKN